MRISKKALAILASFAAAFFLAVLAKIYVIRSGYQLSALEEEEKSKILELSQAEADLSAAKFLEELSPQAKMTGFRFPSEYGLDKIRFNPGSSVGRVGSRLEEPRTVRRKIWRAYPQWYGREILQRNVPDIQVESSDPTEEPGFRGEK